MEHRGMSWIRIASVTRPWRNDPNGRRMLFHRPHLHRGGMGSQNHLIRNKEGGLHLSGRMPFGNIEGLKIVVVQFHFWPFHHFKTQTREDINNLLQNLSDRMFLPDRNPSPRKCYIDLLLLYASFRSLSRICKRASSIFVSKSSLIWFAFLPISLRSSSGRVPKRLRSCVRLPFLPKPLTRISEISFSVEA